MSKINQLGQYKNIEVSVKKQMVTPQEVEQQVQMFVSQNPQFIDKDGQVALGDVTTIDFEGLKDGVAFDGGSAKGFQLEIGSGQFIPGFEEQMIGMEKGETRDLNLTFPENYQAKELAGQDVIFKVTVHHIQEKKAATLNDEFVVSLNVPDMKTVEDLYQRMEENIQAQYDQTYRTDVENTIFNQLIQQSDVEVEDADIARAMEEHIAHIRQELARQGMALEQYLQMMGMNEEALREQLTPAAKQQAVFEAIIDEVVILENLSTSEEEVNQQIEAIAAHNQMSKEDVLTKVDPQDLKRDFNRVKASQLIITSANIHE